MSAAEWFLLGIFLAVASVCIAVAIASINEVSEAEDAEQRRIVGKSPELDDQLRREGLL